MSKNRFVVKVEVESEFVDSRGGMSAKGKPYEIHEQKVWAYLNSKFPKEISVNLESADKYLREGMYEVDIAPALEVGDFNRLSIDGRKLKFVPVVASVAAAKA